MGQGWRRLQGNWLGHDCPVAPADGMHLPGLVTGKENGAGMGKLTREQVGA